MGVPSFFRWLCKRYPRVVSDANEQTIEDYKNQFELALAQFNRRQQQQQQQQQPQNEESNNNNTSNTQSAPTSADDSKQTTLLPPTLDNNPEIDNLYLDMNGIIHPVSRRYT